MRIFNQPACQRGLRAKLNISFVGDDYRFTACQLQQRAQILRVDKLSGRIIGATNEHHFCAVKVVGNPL